MAQKIKDLSIIIVSFNTKDLTVACIESVLRHTKGVNLEIVVVDNNSHDGSVAALKKIKKVRLIENKENSGFAAANNQAIKVCRGEFMLLLNSDTLLTSNVLENATRWMEKHPRVGVYSCALHNVDGSIQATGGHFPILSRVFNWMYFIDDIPFISDLLVSYHPKKNFYRSKHYLDWVTGAFFLTRAELWKNVGFFDEEYFMYVEEVDFCYRASKLGWKVFYDPDFSIIHYGGASSHSKFSIISEYKGLKIFYKKHFPSWQLPVLRLILKCGALLRVVIFGLLRGQKSSEIYAEAFSTA